MRDDEMGGLDDSQGRAPVDLDRLFAELDTTGTFTPVAGSELEEVSPEGSGAVRAAPLHPAQPAFDFGESDGPRNLGGAGPEDFSTETRSDGEEAMSRKVLMAGGAVVALSLLLGAVGLFTAFSAASRIDALQQSVDALTERIATLQVSGDPRVGQLQAEQAGIVSRLDEMAARLDGMANNPATRETATTAELRKRQEGQERNSTQAPNSTATATAAAKKTAAKPAPASGDWTVILVSFATSAQAENEKSRLQKLGIHSEVSKTVVDGKSRFRLRVPGYTSQETAKAAIPAIERKSGIKGAWVAHR
ncbi:MAG TPA: SPOR domain-containing protein [Gammaproteobacteria bacterium]